MDIRPRHAEQNHYINPGLINKYHFQVSKSFNTAWLSGIRQYITTGKVKFRFTRHCKERCLEKNIPSIPCERFIKEGLCFEYKTIGNTLYRFAVRLVGKLNDYIAVFQPELRDGILEMVVVTYYSNSKNDHHRTLRRWEYCN